MLADQVYLQLDPLLEHNQWHLQLTSLGLIVDGRFKKVLDGEVHSGDTIDTPKIKKRWGWSLQVFRSMHMLFVGSEGFVPFRRIWMYGRVQQSIVDRSKEQAFIHVFAQVGAPRRRP